MRAQTGFRADKASPKAERCGMPPSKRYFGPSVLTRVARLSRWRGEVACSRFGIKPRKVSPGLYFWRTPVTFFTSVSMPWMEYSSRSIGAITKPALIRAARLRMPKVGGVSTTATSNPPAAAARFALYWLISSAFMSLMAPSLASPASTRMPGRSSPSIATLSRKSREAAGSGAT